MKLSISNIGWDATNDEAAYEIMKKYGFSGLEIAPTRIFPENPYEDISKARSWAEELRANEGFVIPSMQSIWYGRSEKIFGSDEERETLIDYTKKAIDFAEAIGCKNLVFGCPRNRNIEDGMDASFEISFFKEIGDYAYKHNTVIGMEANPPIYNTNYINDTLSAIELIDRVGSDGFKLNLDIGTMIQNNEDINELAGKVSLFSHVHISEPGLKIIEERKLHKDLKELLNKENYSGFVSVEMGKRDELSDVDKVLKYISELFREIR